MVEENRKNQRKKLLCGGRMIALGTAVALAGLGMPGLASASAQPVQVQVMNYAACNGGDDTAGLKAALGALRTGDTLVIPAGVTCRHSTVLKISTAGVRVTGPGTLLATDESQAGVWVNANNITVDGGLVLKATATKRWSTPNQTNLVLQKGTTGAVIRDVTSDGSGGAGVIILGASGFTLDRVTVLNSWADGIHMTAGAHTGTITNPVVRGSGDDGISIVSYKSTAEPCHDITITSAKVYYNKFGGGMSMIGGYNLTYTHAYVEGSTSAAIIITSNTTWNTHPTRNVQVLSATLVKSNTMKRIRHGAVLIASSTPEGISGVSLKNITIRNTRLDAPANVQALSFSGAPITGITMDRFTITGGPAKDFNTSTGVSYTLTNWVVNGSAVPNRNAP